MLWEVVYADGHLDDYESNLLRRVAGLIHVSDRERGDARRRVLDRLGVDTIYGVCFRRKTDNFRSIFHPATN